MIRRLLFQVHLWIGLLLGALFVLISMSGSFLMIGSALELDRGEPNVALANTKAPPVSIERMVESARMAVHLSGGADAQVTLPRTTFSPANVHFSGPMDLPDVLIDPAIGQVVTTYRPYQNVVLNALSNLHSHLFLGKLGRALVGWLGVAMAILGLSGLFLWWPKGNQWRSAFLVRRKARGVRLHRELHGAAGIWSLLFFLLVALSGVGIVFHETARTLFAAMTGGIAAEQHSTAPMVQLPVSPLRLPGWQLVALAEEGRVRVVPTTITLPAAVDRAVTVQFGDWTGPIVYLNPYQARQVADPSPPTSVDSLFNLMGSLHVGQGLGAGYWTLVFLTGLMPLLFFVTGTFMWWKKRAR